MSAPTFNETTVPFKKDSRGIDNLKPRQYDVVFSSPTSLPERMRQWHSLFAFETTWFPR
jgi:hypothetical protein